MSNERPQVAAVVLAAGLSRRLGRSKQLLPWRGTTLLGYTIATLQSAGVSQIAVVTGHDAAAVVAELAKTSVTVVHNPDYAEGQGTSVACGARWAMQSDARRVFFVPCDQPFLSAQHISALLASDQQAAAVMPRVAGRPTSPVLWADHCLFLLTQLTGEQGGRQLFANGAVTPTYIEFTTLDLLQDIDTPEDYAALCAI